ncbi:Homoserine kinase [Xylophilus ampelinus]|uniref:Aminoglycoside phosphotransferase domain-containing protein n=1 Tax=Variovorax paradoxus TaxID=34073 RepID=A0A2W5QN24_VARPD|nr:MAG: hypothetical protein DI563_00030 [Variovorax paradoxus]VTY30090.1 Homoserine kinase [Xylophilus ampelinus]
MRGPLEPGNAQSGINLGELRTLLDVHYGLDASVNAGVVLPKSTTSPKLLITSGGEAFVVKFMPRYIDSPSVYEARIATLHELAWTCPAVVAPLPNRDGFLLTQLDARWFWVSRHRAGKPYTGLPTETREAAQSLRELHVALARLPDVHHEYRSSADFARFFIELARRSAHESGELYLLDSFADLAQRMETPEPERMQLVHGDPTIPNFLFGGDGTVAGIFDFDDLRRGSVLRDVATLMVSTCCLRYKAQSSTMSGVVSSTIRNDRVRLVHSGYFGSEDTGLDVLLGQEVLLVWLEMMCLGLVRADFSWTAVAAALPGWLESLRATFGIAVEPPNLRTPR